MLHRHLHTFATVLVLALAVGVGFVVTNRVQRSVPVVSGIEGCWRLEGSARQVSCLATTFRDGAHDAAVAHTGLARDAAIITFVQRQDALAATDARLGGTCHPAMHELGRDEGALAAAADHVPSYPTSRANQLCTAGYVHGLSEGYLSSTPDADVAAVFPKLCAVAAARAGCAHGIGHAVLRAQLHSADARPAAGIARAAAERCTQLPASFRGDCDAGVYMELAMRTTPAPVPVDDYVAICNGARATAQQLACWGYLGQSVASNDADASTVPELCATAPGAVQAPCIESWGRDRGVAGVGGCSGASDRAVLVEACIDGAVALQVGSGHVSAASARRSCGSLRTGVQRDACTDAVGRYAAARDRAEPASVRSTSAAA